MALFGTPERHAANPPDTWKVTLLAPRRWDLQTSDGRTIDSFTTKKAAETAKVEGFLVRLYGDEGRWFAGETPAGQRSYAECRAERAAAYDARWAGVEG